MILDKNQQKSKPLYIVVAPRTDPKIMGMSSNRKRFMKFKYRFNEVIKFKLF